MQQEKTVLEWLEQAKADGYEWADEAIENCKKYESGIVTDNCLSQALLGAFRFSEVDPKFWQTKNDKWNNIVRQLEENGL